LVVMNCIAIVRQFEAGIIHATKGYITGVTLSIVTAFFYSFYLCFSSYRELVSKTPPPITLKLWGILVGVFITVFFFIVPTRELTTLIVAILMTMIAIGDIAGLFIRKPTTRDENAG